ncbi:MAG: NAD-dependent epimerase/dehydratase family protein, partial [Prevotellaceae bacterium]|nr:NAD-dependent epimerase/dehydratase family protein [Prevotellaceae bacterium]
MNRVSLIGASGFVGTRLIDRLKDRYTIVNFDKRQSAKYPELTTVVDICDRDALRPLLKGFDLTVLLAAEHRDDVSPVSLYYEVNVEGTRNVLDVMDENGIKNIVFTSSVAVYGLNKTNPNENHPADPFNHYGRSKWQAEEILREWHSRDATGKMLRILRPTVIFGERNRGNVYNLLRQISSGRFLKTGKCDNKKSMAYVGNIVAFIEYLMETAAPGYGVYNYTDKPDLSMNELVETVGRSLGRKIPSIRIPYRLGMLGGYCFDCLAWITRRKFPVSSVRVKKFCATTQFDSDKAHSSGFTPPYTLSQGIDRTIKFEFVHEKEDDI